MAKADPRLVFIDANVLKAAVTRTLLLVGSDPSGFRYTWSQTAEEEANRHLSARATSVTTLRTQILGRALGPTGPNAAQFVATDIKDRQILADAHAAGAGFLITTDVDDFAEIDLVDTLISAVNPDFFMSLRLTEDAYRLALQQLVANMKNPPRTVAEMHGLIAARHPRLFATFADLYDALPARQTGGHEPGVIFRGARCVLCGRQLSKPSSLLQGLGPDCRTKA